jgi:hypothetical protein
MNPTHDSQALYMRQTRVAASVSGTATSTKSAVMTRTFPRYHPSRTAWRGTPLDRLRTSAIAPTPTFSPLEQVRYRLGIVLAGVLIGAVCLGAGV